MKRLKLAALAFTLAAAACALIYFAADRVYGAAGKSSLSLWYLNGSFESGALSRMGRSYNLKAGRGDMRVSLRGFASEDELAAALETEVPDMLLCSYLKAADLESRGLLSEPATEGVDCPEDIKKVMPAAGKSFFPVGSNVQVLLRNTELCRGIAEPDSLEALAEQCALYAEETGSPFLSAQSYAELFNAQLCSLGASFSGDIRADAANEDFRRVHNLLAGCGYDHGLTASGGDCARSVAAGELPCAFVPSSVLPYCDGKTVSVMAPPLPEGGEALCPAELMGIAVTSTRSERLPSVAAFLDWLANEGGGDTLALASGLVPLGGGASGKGGFWAQELTGLAQERRLVYPAPDSEYFTRRAEFDAAFAQTLDLLQ